MPKVIINGIPLETEGGTTVLDAARFLGIPIPTLCHEDGLTPAGACRLCVVEVKNARGSKLLSACTLGFKVVLLQDAIRGLNVAPEDSEKAIAEMRAAGAVTAATSDLAL